MGQCALAFETHGEETTYLFLYALQRPMLVALLPLTKTELVLPALASLDSTLLETLAGIHHNTYKMCMGQFVWDSDIVCGTYTNVNVIPHMFCSGDGVIYSDSSSVPLEDYLGEALLKDKVVKHKRSADNERTDDQDLSYRFPFLKRYLAGDPLEPKAQITTIPVPWKPTSQSATLWTMRKLMLYMLHCSRGDKNGLLITTSLRNTSKPASSEGLGQRSIGV